MVYGSSTGCLKTAALSDEIGNSVSSFAVAWGTSFIEPRFGFRLDLPSSSGRPLPPKLHVWGANGTPLSEVDKGAVERLNKTFAGVVPAARQELVLLAAAGVTTAISNDVSPSEVWKLLGGKLRRLCDHGCYTKAKTATPGIMQLVVVLIAMCSEWTGLTKKGWEDALASAGVGSALVRGGSYKAFCELPPITVVVGDHDVDFVDTPTDYAFEECGSGGEEEEDDEEEQAEKGDDGGDCGNDDEKEDEEEEEEAGKEEEGEEVEEDGDDDADEEEEGGPAAAPAAATAAPGSSSLADAGASPSLCSALHDPGDFRRKLFVLHSRRATTPDVSEAGAAAWLQKARESSDALIAMVDSAGLATVGVVGGRGAAVAASRSASSSSAGAPPLSGYPWLHEVLSRLEAVSCTVEAQAASSWTKTARAAGAKGETKKSADSSSSSPPPSSSSKSSSRPPLLVQHSVSKMKLVVCSLFATMVPRDPAALRILSDVLVNLTSDELTAGLVVPFFSVIYRLYLHLKAGGKENALGVAVLDALPFLQHFMHNKGKSERKKTSALYFLVAAYQLENECALCSIGEAIKMGKRMGLPTLVKKALFSRIMREADPVVLADLRRKVHIYDVDTRHHLAIRCLCGCCECVGNGGNALA